MCYWSKVRVQFYMLAAHLLTLSYIINDVNRENISMTSLMMSHKKESNLKGQVSLQTLVLQSVDGLSWGCWWWGSLSTQFVASPSLSRCDPLLHDVLEMLLGLYVWRGGWSDHDERFETAATFCGSHISLHGCFFVHHNFAHKFMVNLPLGKFMVSVLSNQLMWQKGGCIYRLARTSCSCTVLAWITKYLHGCIRLQSTCMALSGYETIDIGMFIAPTMLVLWGWTLQVQDIIIPCFSKKDFWLLCMTLVSPWMCEQHYPKCVWWPKLYRAGCSKKCILIFKYAS